MVSALFSPSWPLLAEEDEDENDTDVDAVCDDEEDTNTASSFVLSCSIHILVLYHRNALQ